MKKSVLSGAAIVAAGLAATQVQAAANLIEATGKGHALSAVGASPSATRSIGGIELLVRPETAKKGANGIQFADRTTCCGGVRGKDGKGIKGGKGKPKSGTKSTGTKR